MFLLCFDLFAATHTARKRVNLTRQITAFFFFNFSCENVAIILYTHVPHSTKDGYRQYFTGDHILGYVIRGAPNL